MTLTPEVLIGDCREILPTLPAASVHCVITSPPYYQLRDYNCEGQIGREESPEAYLETMVDVFRHVRRVMRPDATLWCNMGDSYASAWPCRRRSVVGNGSLENGKREERAPRLGFALKDKDLMMMPHRLAIALQNDGWYVRSAITITKNNPMPESVTDRPTSATEMLFLLTKQASYFYDADAVREKTGSEANWESYEQIRARNGGWTGPDPTGSMVRQRTEGKFTGTHPAGRNKRNWWVLNSQPLRNEQHFAAFSEKLVEPCIKAGTSEWGACQACGSPWRRMVEKESIPTRPGRESCTDQTKDHFIAKGSGGNTNLRFRTMPQIQTTGWQATCKCEADVVPCTVMDPFAGSGTVGRVATKLGRKSILIELSPDYAKIIERRNAQLGLML